MAGSAIIRPHSVKPVALSELARDLGFRHEGPDQVVTGLSVHTDLLANGDLFVAVAGTRVHGITYWPQAKTHGAVAVLTDEEGFAQLSDSLVPVLIAASPRAVMGAVAARIYGTKDPSMPAVYAVTGTNGKTSTAFLLEALMRSLGWKTALSTTAERTVNGVQYASTLTTPEAPDIHAMLSLAKQEGVAGVAIEVSAQAIAKNRIDDLVMTVSGFTNLSHDHFEDFGDMDRYLLAKAPLFYAERTKASVVCIDSEWGSKLLTHVTSPFVTLGSEKTGADWTYRVQQVLPDGSVFALRSPLGEEIVARAPVLGDHMVSNAALAIAMLVTSGVSLAEIGAAIGPETEGIPVFLPGRIERVSGEKGPQVFVDAGRSEDAYRVTLRSVRERTKGRVVMVCGTSGNRDATKRPLMGRAAAELADVVVITDDDPRREDPHTIRQGLLEGALSVPGAEVHEIPHPSDAIRFAVSLVGEGDSILWSGPGSQSYRDIGGEKIPYSAREEARAALREAGWETTA